MGHKGELDGSPFCCRYGKEHPNSQQLTKNNYSFTYHNSKKYHDLLMLVRRWKMSENNEKIMKKISLSCIISNAPLPKNSICQLTAEPSSNVTSANSWVRVWPSHSCPLLSNWANRTSIVTINGPNARLIIRIKGQSIRIRVIGINRICEIISFVSYRYFI